MPGSQPAVSVLITCEHASCAIPARWQLLFAGHEDVLASHRGWDPGAIELARRLAGHLDAALLVGRASRLLVDLNRSAGHPQRFSEFTRGLAPEEKREIERDWWQPHWLRYRRFIEHASQPVVHIACHSFTPVLAGRPRRVDIGLLHDPSRAPETQFCRRLRGQIELRQPDLRVRMNAPYQGRANGLGQQHRRVFSLRRLISVELEVNQALVARGDWPEIITCLVSAAAAAVVT